MTEKEHKEKVIAESAIAELLKLDTRYSIRRNGVGVGRSPAWCDGDHTWVVDFQAQQTVRPSLIEFDDPIEAAKFFIEKTKE